MTDRCTLVFTGDVGFDRYMDGRWEDDALISDEVLAFLHSADHVITNVEGPLVAQPANTATEGAQQLKHTMNPAAVRVFKRMHADIWNLCNNHIMDAGAEGLRCSLQEAAKAGVQTIGAGMDLEAARRPLILDEAGGIGLFGVGYQRACRKASETEAGCLSWSDMDTIRDTIREIKARCRWCVVVSHGGEEFTALPSPYTRERYLQYLDMGADLVVCHHPHVPMNYELVGEKAIFYSLGNFIFDTPYQRSQYHTEEGVVLKLCFTPENYSFEACGIRILRGEERVVKGELPVIFRNVPAQEYELLAPLAAKMFIAATKRQQIYMNPARFSDATDEAWREHFLEPKRSGRVPGEALDFYILLPLAAEEEKQAWRQSSLDDVKEYILQQM